MKRRTLHESHQSLYCILQTSNRLSPYHPANLPPCPRFSYPMSSPLFACGCCCVGTSGCQLLRAMWPRGGHALQGFLIRICLRFMALLHTALVATCVCVCFNAALLPSFSLSRAGMDVVTRPSSIREICAQRQTENCSVL